MDAYKQVRAYSQAADAAGQALEFVEVENDPSLLPEIAILYLDARNDEKSREYFQRYLNLLKKLGKSEVEIGTAIAEVANEYENHRFYGHALEFWKDFVELFSGSKDKDIATFSLYGKLRAFALYNTGNNLNEASRELDSLVKRSVEILGDEHMETRTLKEIRRVFREERKLDMESMEFMVIAYSLMNGI